MSSIVTEAVLQGFDDLAEDIGVEAHFLPPILAIPAESTYIAELQIGGQYQDVDGGVTVRKDKLPMTLKVGGTFWIGGAKVKIEQISTTATDPLMHIAYSILTAPQAVPSTQDDDPSVIIYGGNADTPGGDPSNSLNFWIVKVIQPLNGGTITLHHQNGDPVTAESLQEGSVIEVRIDTGENIELVTWLGDLQQWGKAGSFLHTVNSHLTVTAETSPLLIQVYTDIPEQGGSFNWQTGHTHEAGQSLTLTYTPPSPQHTLSHFQINGETVAHGQVTDFGTLDISGSSIIISDPRKDLTVEAVLEMDCPLAEPTLLGGVNAPDPLPMPGNEATYTANIPIGEELVRWELDGETIPHNEDGSVTITQPAGEFTLEVFLQVITYTLTTPTTPAGNIHLSNYNPEHGEEVTLTFYPATGYGDTSGFQIGDFYTPAPNNSTTWLADKDAAIGVDAEILTFTITATGDNLTFALQDGNGDPITNPVDYGTEVNVTAIPAEGYEFLNWTAHPVITNTNNNPVQFTADQDATLEAFAQQVAEFTGTLDITDGNASILNTGTLTGLDTASSFNLTVSGALLHELFGNQDSLRSFQDALYVFWQAGYGDSNQDSEYAFKAPATYNVNPGQRTAESFNQWWKSDLNDLVSLDETIGTSDHQHLVFNPANNAITIANKSLFLAVRFNSTLGFLPLPLLPYLAAGKTFDPGNFIDSWFQDNAGASNLTVTQIKAALEIINAGLPATDTGRFQITKELVDTQGGAALTEYTRDFNPYTFSVNMDAIETALGAGSGRQTSLDFAIVSTGLNVTGNAIDGVNTTNNVHQLIDGGFKLAVDIA